MKQTEEIKELLTALAIAQGLFLTPKKSKTNPFFNNSKYADLSDVIDATKDALAKNDLAIIQGVDNSAEGQFLFTRLTHKTGQWIEATCPLFIDKRTMQGLGSAVTYARRYSLSSLLGVASEIDDDGNATTSKPANEPPKQPQSSSRPQFQPANVQEQKNISNAGPNLVANSPGFGSAVRSLGKITVGVYTGKYFDEVLKADSVQDFKLARWAHKEMSEFKNINPCYLDYVAYAISEGVLLDDI